MAQGELRDKVASGVAWSIAEKGGSMLLQMGVSLVILNLVTPWDMTVMAVLSIFSAFALVFVDSGFSQMLLRKTEPTPQDYKSVFVFNISAALGLYLLLVAGSPLIARFYDMEIVTRLAPVFFLLLPMNALCVIQNTIYTRQFRFALLSKVTFAASLVSGLAAIGLALAGCGIWSLVIQRLLQIGVRGAILWWMSDWRPVASYNHRALRQMAPYSFSVMSTELISTIYNMVPGLFIGKLYPGASLGYFDQARKLKDSPVNAMMLSVQGVTFPALSRIGDDDRKFAESYRQVVMIVAYVMFPVMMGMSAVSNDMFRALLQEKWWPSIPYFRAICFAGVFYPVAMIAYNVLKVRCKGSLIVRLEILKKIIATGILAATVFHSVQAIVWGLVAIAGCEMIVNVIAAIRVSSLSLWRFLRTLLPITLVSAAMYSAVLVVAQLVPGAAPLRLMAEIAAGVATYVVLSAVFRLEAFAEVMSMVKKQIGK